MQKSMLDAVNEFLNSKGKPTVGPQDALYSSGLLDSMDMMELMLTLNNEGLRVDVEADGTNLILAQMDTVENLEKIRHKE